MANTLLHPWCLYVPDNANNELIGMKEVRICRTCGESFTTMSYYRYVNCEKHRDETYKNRKC
jgi:hypothetical protein